MKTAKEIKLELDNEYKNKVEKYREEIFYVIRDAKQKDVTNLIVDIQDALEFGYINISEFTSFYDILIDIKHNGNE